MLTVSTEWADEIFIFPIAVGLFTLGFYMASFTLWAIGIVATLTIPLLIIQVRRWEDRVNGAVERYITAYEAVPAHERHLLQMLCRSVGQTLLNNRELTAVRVRIRKRGVPDPASESPTLAKERHLLKFLRYAQTHGLPLDTSPRIIVAIGRYKGVLK